MMTEQMYNGMICGIAFHKYLSLWVYRSVYHILPITLSAPLSVSTNFPVPTNFPQLHVCFNIFKEKYTEI